MKTPLFSFGTIFVLTFGFACASFASSVVAVLEGEIPGFESRDKVIAQISVTTEANGTVRFSQCTTINNQKIPSCEWLENAFPFSLKGIQAIQASIPNDTIRVFTDSSTEAAEARSFLRMNGQVLVKAIETASKGESVNLIRAAGIYNAHKVFPYILWRARTF